MGNGVLRGLAADTKPTTYAVGSTFQEIDTGNQFYWNGTSWTAMGGGGGLSSPATISGVNFADVGITNTDSPYTVLATKTIIRADASAAAITINLPTAIGIAGRTYTIFRTDITQSSNIITVDANSTETIDSNLTYLLYPAEWIQIMSDGANWQVIDRPTPNADYFYLKGATADRRYLAGMGRYGAFQNTATSTTAPALNTLFAIPMIIGKTTKFDTISFRVTTVAAAGGVGRAGIYRDNGNCYPGALIFDTGSIAIDSGATMKNTTITAALQVFQPGLYWLAYECGTASAQMTILQTMSFSLMGWGPDYQTNIRPAYCYQLAHTFGALPNPYTAGATLFDTGPAVSVPIPLIGLRPI